MDAVLKSRTMQLNRFQAINSKDSKQQLRRRAIRQNAQQPKASHSYDDTQKNVRPQPGK